MVIGEALVSWKSASLAVSGRCQPTTFDQARSSPPRLLHYCQATKGGQYPTVKSREGMSCNQKVFFCQKLCSAPFGRFEEGLGMVVSCCTTGCG